MGTSAGDPLARDIRQGERTLGSEHVFEQHGLTARTDEGSSRAPRWPGQRQFVSQRPREQAR